MKRSHLLGLLLVLVVVWLGVQDVRGQEPEGTPTDFPAFETMAPKSFDWEENPPLEATMAFAASLLSRQAEKSSSSQFGPQPLENWSRAAVQAISENGWDIYTFRLDGTDERRLTDHPASDVNPNLNPAGTEIVFTSYRDGNSEIYKVAVDGSSPPQRLTNNAAPDNWASWSPDGGQILFSSGRDGQYELYVMNWDGSNQHRIIHTDLYHPDNQYSHDVMAVWGVFGDIYFVRYGPSGSGVLYRTSSEAGLDVALTDEIVDLENLRIGKRGWESYLFFDADIDNDGATELLARCVSVSCLDKPLLQLLDSGSPNVDLLAGAIEPVDDPTRDGIGILYTRLYFHTEGDNTIVDDFGVEWGEWTADNQVSGLKPLIGAAIVSDWGTDDTVGPTIYPPVMSEYTQSDPNGEIPLRFEGIDPGGSGIQSVMVQVPGNTDWENVWSIDQTTVDGSITLYDHYGKDGLMTFRLRGKDAIGNDGPWTEAISLKYFSNFLRSQVLDGHGRPVPNPEIVHTWGTLEGDTVGDLNGLAVVRSYLGYQIAMQHPGFGQAKQQNVLETSFSPHLSLVPITPFVLPPKDSVFQNGNFSTNSLADWQIVGDPNLIGVVNDGIEYGGGKLTVGSYNLIYAMPQLGIQRSINLSLLHKPVLGLYLTGTAFAKRDSRMSVSIQAGEMISDLLVIKDTVTFPNSAPLSTSYTNHSGSYNAYFFDLAEWKTETITLSLLLHGASDSVISGYFGVSSISLGSWTTPVIDSIGISTTQGISETLRLRAGDPVTQTLVLTGQNFLPGVKIKAGSIVLQGVKRFGEERLEVMLPVDLPVGLHNIWVVNTDQTTAVLPSALAIGEQLFLPLLGR